ncbi:YabP/YqfC family sporulation protein [Pelosinus baikalensis]|mgnify:CR=1 FL=1|uniref:YabP/YqfC family sporulation protein n=1 Tax=Pelosinus baikalensis TaxID=2892015 RepID=A0ABS8HV83_9FIRM|nr:YabP/YqfC family sporulation protein [Pelosinus baikalensis]
MTIDNKTPTWRHQITLVDREEMTIDGVLSLGSYDEKEVIMETEQGVLIVKGEGLNIKQLNLDKSNIVVEGLIKGVSYDDTSHNKKGLLERFLK